MTTKTKDLSRRGFFAASAGAAAAGVTLAAPPAIAQGNTVWRNADPLAQRQLVITTRSFVAVSATASPRRPAAS